jgi:hypothetical protein
MGPHRQHWLLTFASRLWLQQSFAAANGSTHSTIHAFHADLQPTKCLDWSQHSLQLRSLLTLPDSNAILGRISLRTSAHHGVEHVFIVHHDYHGSDFCLCSAFTSVSTLRIKKFIIGDKRIQQYTLLITFTFIFDSSHFNALPKTQASIF